MTFTISGSRAALAAGLALGALAGCSKPPQPPPPPPRVGYVSVRTVDAPLTTELPGRTSPFLQSDVRPQVNGIIKARLFKEGSEVRAGQVLYEIDPAPYQSALAQARAALANAQASALTTRLKAERYGDLVKINAVSKQDYDDAEAAAKQAEATAQQNRAVLGTAQINLGYTRVTAPISGRIGRSALTPGALAVAGQTTALATIQSLDPIYVDVSQSADELLRLRTEMASHRLVGSEDAGARVSLVLADGAPYPLTGRLTFSEALVDPATGTVTIRAVFPNPNRLLLPGMFVRAELEEGVVHGAVLVPQRAVTRNEKGEALVYLVGPNQTAEPRIVRTARTLGDDWLITSGLAPGDRLIVDGLIAIHGPGQKVRPAPADSPSSPPAASPPATRGR